MWYEIVYLMIWGEIFIYIPQVKLLITSKLQMIRDHLGKHGKWSRIHYHCRENLIAYRKIICDPAKKVHNQIRGDLWLAIICDRNPLDQQWSLPRVHWWSFSQDTIDPCLIDQVWSLYLPMSDYWTLTYHISSDPYLGFGYYWFMSSRLGMISHQ
jgi:hypothetical protein